MATGQDSLGEASVVLDVAGQSAAPVKGVSIDIIEAAALAHLRAVNAER